MQLLSQHKFELLEHLGIEPIFYFQYHSNNNLLFHILLYYHIYLQKKNYYLIMLNHQLFVNLLQLQNQLNQYVYHYYLTDYDNYDYVVGNFGSAAEFEKYMEYPRAHNMIYTGVDINYGDKFITLQTCVKYHQEQRLIIVAKEVSRDAYPADYSGPDVDITDD